MKRVLALAFACTAYAAPSLACDAYSVNVYGHALFNSLTQFTFAAQNDFQWSWAAGQAQQLGQLAHHIGDLGEVGNCFEASSDFANELAPSYRSLDSQVDPRLGSSANYNLRQIWAQVESNYVALQNAAAGGIPGPGPGPGPQPDACYGLGGYYQGVCRANAGQSAISFAVGAQGGACIVSQAQYFQPAYLQVGAGRADADVQQIPGGVAIQNTHLAVFGGGRFQMTGYNYAGHFNFVCN